MKRLFNRLIPKYEIFILKIHEDYVKERLVQLQNDGWRIAGDVFMEKSHASDDFLLKIILKRII